MMQKTSCSPSAAVPCGEGGGVICRCRARGLALEARRDAGTTSRSGEGACRASRRGSSLRARCEGLSGTGSAADAGLALKPCQERACPHLTGRWCQHLPTCCPPLLGGRLSRRRVSLVPRAAAPADSPAQLKVAVARGRAMVPALGPNRPSALALPPRALLFHPGDPRDVLPPRPASVGEQCWPPSRGAREIGYEEACRLPPAGCGLACAGGVATLPANAGPGLAAAVPCPP